MIPTAPLFPTTPTFVRVTGGSAVIPRGSLSWSINVLSGQATINGVGPFVPPFADSSPNRILGDITVICSGAGHLTALRYDAPPTSVNI